MKRLCAGAVDYARLRKHLDRRRTVHHGVTLNYYYCPATAAARMVYHTTTTTATAATMVYLLLYAVQAPPPSTVCRQTVVGTRMMRRRRAIIVCCVHLSLGVLWCTRPDHYNRRGDCSRACTRTVGYVCMYCFREKLTESVNVPYMFTAIGI